MRLPHDQAVYALKERFRLADAKTQAETALAKLRAVWQVERRDESDLLIAVEAHLSILVDQLTALQ